MQRKIRESGKENFSFSRTYGSTAQKIMQFS